MRGDCSQNDRGIQSVEMRMFKRRVRVKLWMMGRTFENVPVSILLRLVGNLWRGGFEVGGRGRGGGMQLPAIPLLVAES